MAKEVAEPAGEGGTQPGTDLLRALAGYPTRAVHFAKWGTKSRTIFIQRDALGRVIGSTEQIHQDEFTALDGDWIN